MDIFCDLLDITLGHDKMAAVSSFSRSIRATSFFSYSSHYSTAYTNYSNSVLCVKIMVVSIFFTKLSS